jgi:endonuclease/exonuclease/phosphatase family metal-dependent hydrolase
VSNRARSLIIDWILASNHFTVLDAAIDDYNDNGLYPSDHFPVTATLALQ